jgi:hypothetical protein
MDGGIIAVSKANAPKTIEAGRSPGGDGPDHGPEDVFAKQCAVGEQE